VCVEHQPSFFFFFLFESVCCLYLSNRADGQEEEEL
jgi:hypothetical protein